MAAFFRFPRLLLVLYMIVACADLVGLALDETWSLIHLVAKPLLMPCLIMFVWLERKEIQAFAWVIAALTFSWMGDVLLMKSGTIWFILGLSSFLIAHVCYIRRFMLGGNKADSTMLKKIPWLEALVFAVFINVFLWLWPTLGEMKLPVTIYSIVIYFMVFVAFSRRGRIPDSSFWVVLAGALLFVLSDSLIAISRFAGSEVSIPQAAIWIMLTYTAAQGLIVWGIRLEKNGTYSTESNDTV